MNILYDAAGRAIAELKSGGKFKDDRMWQVATPDVVRAGYVQMGQVALDAALDKMGWVGKCVRWFYA